MTTVAEALTRLQIVRDAVEGTATDNPLAGAEAHHAVRALIEAVLDDPSADPACEHCLTIYVLARNAIAHLATLPMMSVVMPQRTYDFAFETFAITVEHLISLLEVEDHGKARLGEPFCWVHGMPELTDEEQAIVEAGDIDDICVFVARTDTEVTA
jgi:hypothetical protein